MKNSHKLALYTWEVGPGLDFVFRVDYMGEEIARQTVPVDEATMYEVWEDFKAMVDRPH